LADFSLSLSNLDNRTILPGSGYHRKTVNLGFTQTMAKKLTVSGNINYSNEDAEKPAEHCRAGLQPGFIIQYGEFHAARPA
jgi:hypothetical protein